MPASPGAAAAEAVMVWVAEPGVQGVGIHIAMAMDPIDFVGEGAVEDAGVVGGNCEIDVGFEEGVSELLKSLDVTLRKDKESGRPRINKRGSVLDREQKAKGKWAVF